MAGGKMLVQIVKQLTEAQALPAAGYRAQDLLRLTAVAMGRDGGGRRRWRLRCRNLHAPDADKVDPAALPAEVISKASPT